MTTSDTHYLLRYKCFQMVVAWKCLKIVAWLQWPGSIPYWRHNVHSRSSASHLSWVSWQSGGSGCKDQTLPSSSQTPFISAHWTEFRIHTEWKCQIMANHTENVPVANTEQENNTEEEARHPGDTSPGDINKNDYESMIQKKNIAKVNAVQFHFQWKVNKISYLTCNVQHSIDLAYMLSTVKQMRHSLALDEDWKKYLLVSLLAVSVLLQLVASALLLTEQNTSDIRQHKK